MSSPVARRYAQALFGEAVRKDVVERVDEDVQLLRESLAGSRDLKLFLERPFVSREKKAAVLGRLFGERVHELTTGFLSLLLEKQRERILPEILDAYSLQRDARLGIVEAHVRAAKPLSPDAADALRKRIEERTGKTVRLRMDVVPDLIGGLVVRMGDMVYDQSVRHQIDELREDLLKASAISLN